MFESLETIFSKKKLLKEIIEKRKKEKKIKRFLKQNGYYEIEVKIANNKVFFYAPNSSLLNLIKMREEEIKSLLNNSILCFRYFLKKN